ncbi:MAG: hypothetical protein V1836_02890 [Candidatus Aenigmatarchaeota archaeon]
MISMDLFHALEDIASRSFNINNYDDRLTIQKLTCILQSAGIKLGYDFDWHLRGPYSSSLAKDAFGFYQGNKQPQEYNFSDQDKEKIDKIKDYFSSEVSDPSKVELFGSILFLHTDRSIPLSDDSLIGIVKSLKPWYDEQQIVATRDKIIRSNLFN